MTQALSISRDVVPPKPSALKSKTLIEIDLLDGTAARAADRSEPSHPLVGGVLLDIILGQVEGDLVVERVGVFGVL